MDKTILNISTWSIVKVILVLIAFWFLYLIQDVLLILFVSLILYALIDPVADWFQRHRFPRALAVLLIYLILFVVLGLVVGLLIPPITEQIQKIASVFPEYWGKLLENLSSFKSYSEDVGILENIKQALQSLEGAFERTAGGVFSTVTTVFGGIVSLIVMLVVTFYLVVEDDALKRIVRSIVPDHYFPYLTQIFNRIKEKIGLWARGQLILSLSIFLIAFVGLTVIGVEYALVLALLAGLLEFIPYLGPIFATIPAVFLAVVQSPVQGLFVLIFYILMQQFENHVLVPQVMRRAVGLNPVISVTALLIGAKAAGMLGLLLAIPVAIMVSVILKDVTDEAKDMSS